MIMMSYIVEHERVSMLEFAGVKILPMRISRRKTLDPSHRRLNSLHPIIIGDREFLEIPSSELLECHSIANDHLAIWLCRPVNLAVASGVPTLRELPPVFPLKTP
jgi:hypothetical protein